MTDTLAADDPGVGVLVVPGSGHSLNTSPCCGAEPIFGRIRFREPKFFGRNTNIQNEEKKYYSTSQYGSGSVQNEESFGSFPKWVGEVYKVYPDIPVSAKTGFTSKTDQKRKYGILFCSVL